MIASAPVFHLMLALALAAGPVAPTSPVPAPTPRPTALVNSRFEDGALGEIPQGWVLSASAREAGFRSELAEEPARPGRRCAVIFRESGAGAFGNLMQNLDATPLRGKRIRLKTMLRVEASGTPAARGQLWLRVDRPNKLMGFFDNRGDRPVAGDTWRPAVIVGDVAPDAEMLALGVMLSQGNGKVWVRPFSLEVLGETPAHPHDGPKPLTDRGLSNLQAFARALNYVRFFHPSQEAAQADWDRLVQEGIRAVESAATPAELASRLRDFFGPYAPGAQWLLSSEQPKIPPVPTGAALLVRWRHEGFGQRGKHDSIYSSAREFIPLSEGATSGWADPRSTTTLELGGGVKAWLPSVCFAGADKVTFPSGGPVPAALASPALPEPTTGAGVGNDRATRLGDVALAWGVFQHFYPYFEVTGTDWTAELSKALNSAALDQDAQAFTHTLSRMTAALKDGHAMVLGPGDGALSIPSLLIAIVDEGPVAKFAGESARQVPVGSRILAVDGEPAAVRMARLATEISAATEGWMRRKLAPRLLLGAPGTSVTLHYLTPSGLPLVAVLPRDADPWTLASTGGPALASIAELKPGVWYVDLGRISDQEFGAALPKLVEAKGILFDLRGYPGNLSPRFLQHLTDSPLTSARLNKPIVTQPDGQGWQWDTSGRWDLPPLAPRLKARVAFLSGGGAISYAESILGIVEAYKLADIVGEPSAGTNGNVNPFTLPGGYRLSWTGLKVLKHDGSRHHGVGILPTVPLKPTLKGLAEGRDEVLEKGLELVSQPSGR